jgi:hypothetical protein
MLPDFDRADRIGEFWGYPEERRAQVVGGGAAARLREAVQSGGLERTWSSR